MMDADLIRQRLEDAGQARLLRHMDALDPAARRRLLARLASLPLEDLPELIAAHVGSGASAPVDLAGVAPAPHYPADPQSSDRPWDKPRFHALGQRLLRAGKIALLTVAGGQGTRLGFDGPKGCYPAAPATGKPLFRLLAEWVLAARRSYDADIPWAIMTSPLNHEQTISFFEDQRNFGLPPGEVIFFRQGVMPSLDKDTGDILLAAPDAPATNPDGHGGTIRALHERGVSRYLRERGVEHISYVQVDNPLVKPFDAAFLGLHAGAADSSAEMSSKMIEKTDPKERVGVFCARDGETCIVEYSDLPEHLAQQRDASGRLRFRAGSPAIHAISLEFIDRLCDGGAAHALPFHRAVKKVPHIDWSTGKRVEPSEPNAVKLETFIFDALPLCESSIVLEAPREEEFAPIKNATGADSPATSRAAQIARAARWLEAAGVRVPRKKTGEPDCVVEVSPLTAMTPEDLARASDLPKRIERGETAAI